MKHTYKIGKLIGQGNYGKVYSATLKRDPLVKVAIKVLDKKNMDNEDLQSLKNEVGVMQTIDHPNIVKYIESYSDERFLYLVMQMCEGGTLFDSYDKAVKHGSKLTEKRAVEILEKLFRAINHCHAQNIIHRDIKPANIMYDKSGQIRLVDFGLAIQTNKKMHQVAGTPYFMAPEIFKSDYGPKCDVWALGIVLYMIITGTLPFLGKNREQVKESILNSDFLRPENCSEECADLIENLLCKDVTKRYTAAQALSHPWFSSERDIPDEQILLSEDTLNRMRSFSDQTKLRKAALTLLVKILDDAEVAYLRSVFEKIDYDKSGLLDTTELKQAVKESKINISERELELLIDNIDNNDNRMIDYTEFITSCIDIEKVLTEEKLNAIFDCFDVDHTGIITFDTIKRAFTKFGREIPDKEVIDIILKHDMNNDNEINFDEFKIMMMQLKTKD